MDQLKGSVDVGLEVGLRRALFDGTTSASLDPRPYVLASTEGRKLLYVV